MNKFNVTNILIIIAIVLLLIFLFIIITNPGDTKQSSTNISTKQNIIKNTTNTNNINNTNQNQVYIVNHKAENLSIKGIVKNNTNRNVKNLKIEADIYDKNGNKINTSSDWLEELKPNETWAFSIFTGQTSYTYKNIRLNYN